MIFDINKKYGRLTVVKRNDDGTWHCKCDCGGTINVPEEWLLCRFSISCGCLKGRAKDLRGRRFGMLTAISPVAQKASDGSLRWKCVCDCGKETIVSSNKLLMKRATSCGCNQLISARNGKTFINGTCLELLFTPKIRSNNTSGYTGVSKKRSKWIARITVAKKVYHLGTYDNIEDAIDARKKAEEKWKEILLRPQDA